jgi:hypothetical protein
MADLDRQLSMTHLKFWGHAFFSLASGGETLAIDPYLAEGPIPVSFCPTLICVTHGHGDHLGEAIPLSKRSAAPILAVSELTRYCKAQGADVRPAQPGGTAGGIPGSCCWLAGGVVWPRLLPCRGYGPVFGHGSVQTEGSHLCSDAADWRVIHDGAGGCIGGSQTAGAGDRGPDALRNLRGYRSECSSFSAASGKGDKFPLPGVGAGSGKLDLEQRDFR